MKESCLSGDDHKKIHKNTDSKLSDLGAGTDNGPAGTALLGQVIDVTVDELQALFKENGNNACAEDVKEKADAHFKNQDRNKPVNTTQNPKRDLSKEAKATVDPTNAPSKKPPAIKGKRR